MATYKVTIMGRDYNLTSEDNKDYTERLAAALDKRLKDMKARFTSLTVTDCAVLTALDCMDELGQANRNIDNIRTQIKDYVDDAGRARNQAAAAQREIKSLQERVEQLEKELAERTNFSAMNNVGEAVSAEDILKGDIKAAIGENTVTETKPEISDAQRKSIQDSPYMKSFEQAIAAGSSGQGNDK
ncbi:cell division protein ZapA [Ruminococcus sp.]|uniref:cell division protein ZapA n=1 Tax=Ruminococcus sp. TaxID=41978 RepID=UPI0025905065|nr:cell division protein ZapA [Ruminococcus sp.]MCR5020768.1 cell division protein ZapA [Ruminococcus sp.]